MTNSWYVITGGPSTGKTKLINELAKLGHKIVPEAARTLIDEAVAKGLTVEEFRSDEKRFQYDVAKLKQDTENKLRKKDTIFFDRGMHDTIAYLKYYDFDIDSWIDSLVRKSRYQKVFILEPLERFKDDYARTESIDFSLKIRDMLIDAYKKHEMKPISVPDIGLNNRLQFILDSIESGEK